jgi:sugar fermentation stimulation protein A
VLYEKGTRFDFLLKDPLLPLCYVEVKNVHLKQGDRAFFPDTVTERGRKHMETLALLKEKTPALRAVVLFIIQRQDCDSFAIAEDIDPQYARAAKQALNSGVEFIAYRCKISSQYLRIDRKVPIYW